MVIIMNAISMIHNIKSHGFSLLSNERLENIYKQCSKFKDTSYSFVECGVAKGGGLAMMAYSAGDNNRVFGFDSFEGMPPITKEDIDAYNKSCPLTQFGKVGDNLSGGIENVYNTFNTLHISMQNVNLVKGLFQDTLAIQENIDKLGPIAILRLDGDWYESTKICLEKLYDKVVDGGVIIIDDYGHFIGAKRATDEFRDTHFIVSPLIQTDYTEYYWIKNTSDTSIITAINKINVYNDLWTCSNKMRYDIYNFFKTKSQYTIAEIGAYKGYTTRVLAHIFSKVYAVDNNVEWTNLNKELNSDLTNIEYVHLDIYADKWDIIPDTIDVAFIDAGHGYEHCKSDIINSLKNFKNLQYIVFDDYGVWPGVKQNVNELLANKTLVFEQYIGVNDVPGPGGIVYNVHEGVICKVNRNL